ncbi:MAG: hypothetical protein V3T05_00390 [Myxococcota bacterium]
MRRIAILLAIAAATCSKGAGQVTIGADTDGTSGGECTVDADCAPEDWCNQTVCEQRESEPPQDPEPVPHLAATPASLNFGSVTVNESRTLAVVLENDGETMITISGARIGPRGMPFGVEPMGYGPFWIRPERSREIFITYAPATVGHHEATLTVESEAPDITVQLIGN